MDLVERNERDGKIARAVVKRWREKANPGILSSLGALQLSLLVFAWTPIFRNLSNFEQSPSIPLL